MLVMVDLDNILSQLGVGNPMAFSLADGFDNMMRQLGEMAPIVKTYVYGPPKTLERNASWLSRFDYTIVQCDLVPSKRDILVEKVDTVDARMIEHGTFLVQEMPGITHLCLWTGDQDFVKLARNARMAGKDVVIVAGSRKSLSPELVRFACNKPNGEKAVYIFSPQPGISS